VLSFCCCDNIRIHPDSEKLPKNKDVNYSYDLQNAQDKYFDKFDLSNDVKSISQIGSDTLQTNQYFGLLPSQFDIDYKGFIYVLQWTTSTINVYDSLGVFHYQIGRQGRGPGEFLKPSTFSFDSEYNTLYVLDWPEVEIYKRIDNRFVHDSSFTHNLVYSSTICVLDDYIYINGFLSKPKRNENINQFKSINRFKLSTFEHDKSFGFEYIPISDVLNFKRILSETFLACNQETNTVIGQLKHFPYVFGYDLEGNNKWISNIQNITNPEFTETKGVELTLISNVEIYNNFYPFRNVDLDEFELIQIGQRFPPDYISDIINERNPKMMKFSDPRYHTVLVNSKNGELSVSHKYDLIGAYKDNLLLYIEVDENSISPENKLYVKKFKN